MTGVGLVVSAVRLRVRFDVQEKTISDIQIRFMTKVTKIKKNPKCTFFAII